MEKTKEGMTQPKSNFSEWFSEVISKTELADLRYNVKGFLVHRPWSVIAIKEMYKLYEAELEKKGHKPVIFPAVIPKENFLKEAEHIEGFAPEVFWITKAGNTELTEEIALRPTSETAMYTMYAKWIRSWRDLPLKLYQSCQVWRYETKATRPFIRGREFYWIEAHDAFASREEAESQVKEDMEMTENIMHKEFGIPFIFFRRPEWDKFAGAVYTYAADTLMPDGKALQQPSTHLLGQNFAKSFGIKFVDRNEKEKTAWQTCYGPAIWRMFASVIALHGDDKGLVFPFKIAPLQVIIIPIILKGKEKPVLEKCKEIKEKLQSCFRIDVDFSDNTPGWKFNYWEMKGVPVRIEIGPKEVESEEFVVIRRDTGEKAKVKENQLQKTIEALGKDLTKNLVEKADKWFNGMIHSVKTLDELKEKRNKGGFFRVNFCSADMDGKECAEVLKEKFHLNVRGEMANREEKPEGNCIVCGKPAKVVVYLARQY
ncbi:MAG: proline--tRNA ligase [Candidatus Aenigmatarchaeota archaeon]|nr:MAG: proline--tRNA ligase [Candidatus Aenigmarchaeota archaeon]